jgi:chemotaxis protein MotB
MAGRLRSHRSDNIWPGFVDALATLLLVIMFLLVVFVLAHVFLSQALSGRDEALERLNNQISELANLLALERDTSTELRTNVSQLSASLQQSTKSRDALGLEMETLRAQLADANQALAERDSKIASTGSDRDALAARIARLEAALAQSSDEAAALRARARDLQDDLAAAEVSTAEKLAALQAAMVARLAAQEADAAEKLRAADEKLRDAGVKLDEADRKLAAADKKSSEDVKQLDEERKVSAAALGQVALLNQQLAALRLQISRINQALEISEALDKKQKATILDLGKRLNVALAKKVEELAQFRSEFFGRLKKALGDRRDVQVVGDRFVFQSEVLFTSGSAELGLPGKDQLGKLAATVLEIARKIPGELPWVLRVDGHTDRIPIATARFPSNWALSTSRALSVVNFLIEQGVPPERLAAAGFGEFQPLDARNDEIAYRRNRRIEIKLTQR